MINTSPPSPPNAPLLNLPKATQGLALTIIGMYLLQMFLPAATKAALFVTLGFVPVHFTMFPPPSFLNLLSPVTYMFLHASILHVVMNTLMLVAFGAGVERWLGSRNFLYLFFGTGIAAIIMHFFYALAVDNMFGGYAMEQAVIGASGATSGLFAVCMVYLQKMGMGIGAGPRGLLPLILVFIGISVVFGLTGSPDGNSVAWIAHIAGFLSGFVLLRFMKQL